MKKKYKYVDYDEDDELEDEVLEDFGVDFSDIPDSEDLNDIVDIFGEEEGVLDD